MGIHIEQISLYNQRDSLVSYFHSFLSKSAEAESLSLNDALNKLKNITIIMTTITNLHISFEFVFNIFIKFNMTTIFNKLWSPCHQEKLQKQIFHHPSTDQAILEWKSKIYQVYAG